MKSSTQKTLLVISILTIGLSAFYLYQDKESLELNSESRSELGGQYIALSEGVVHYELSNSATRAKDEKAQTVVLVNGFSSPMSIFDPTFSYLKQDHKVLRFDYYGRGYSDRIDASYDINLYVEQLHELLAALNIDEQINIVGLSMGGAVVTHFSNRYPDQVKKVSLIDPLFHTPNRADLTAVQIPGLGEYLATTVIIPDMINGAAEFVHDPLSFPNWAEKFSPQTHYKGFSQAILKTARFLAGKNFKLEYEKLGQSGKPVQLFWGVEDQVIPIATADTIKELIPNLEYHTIEQAGHLPHYEQADRVNPLIDKFINTSALTLKKDQS